MEKPSDFFRGAFSLFRQPRFNEPIHNGTRLPDGKAGTTRIAARMTRIITILIGQRSLADLPRCRRSNNQFINRAYPK